jgi:enoyl-CoA hydratase
MNSEFHEGVRAVILDKDNDPKWRYASIADVPDAEIDAVFAPLPVDQAWVPLEI